MISTVLLVYLSIGMLLAGIFIVDQELRPNSFEELPTAQWAATVVSIVVMWGPVLVASLVWRKQG